MSSSALQQAGSAVARAARLAKTYPSDPAYRDGYNAAVERLAAVRALTVIARGVNGAQLTPEAQSRVVHLLAALVNARAAA